MVWEDLVFQFITKYPKGQEFASKRILLVMKHNNWSIYRGSRSGFGVSTGWSGPLKTCVAPGPKASNQ
ncbi:hypothetical protein MtrunA17_Chr7g0231391 [Medicago truncatula]|uniref:Uncharacterized protein n=1 Tax=Medicago truncatula TaxID=3880 RepID=A0A396H174_MEDTR|nr:hypothetical protein MtrunA17_Chr7g0231391 [Medicago truncatula]